MANDYAVAGWSLQRRPPALTRRYSFASYGATRDFLDALAEWSEQCGYYPDLGFGTTYVNVTLNLTGDAPTPEEEARTTAIDALAADPGQV